MTDVLIVVDMQVGLLDGGTKYDLPGVVDRINRVAAHVRARSGRVIFVQHHGPSGDAYEPGSPGWRFLPELVRHPDDMVVAKTLNDPFCGTDLKSHPGWAFAGAGSRCGLGDGFLRRLDRAVGRVERV